MKITSRSSTRTLLALIIFASCACLIAAQDKAKQPEPSQPKSLDELKSAMQSVLDKQHIPGAGIALVANGEILWCGGLGKADIAANRDISCDTEFRVGSISKSFVSLALLKLVEEGKLDLNARLSDLAPEVPVQNSWSATNPVRVANLLEHTAGFDDMSFSEAYNLHDSPDMPLLKVFQEHPGPQNVRWPPSTRFSYSNPGYGIAGYLIEKISGQPFDQYIKQNILAPIGITTGEFHLTPANKALLSQGYEANPPKIVPYREIYLRPAGDMKASPGELAKFVQFFLRRGVASGNVLIHPESLVRMEYPHTTLSAQNGMRLGYGLANYTEVVGKVVTHGHDGGIGGFISSYRYMPEQNWGYVVLLNSTISGKAIEDLSELAINFLSRDFPKATPATVPLTASELQTFAGYYEPAAPRNQLFAFLGQLTEGFSISAGNGVLLQKGLFGKPESLYPLGKNLFRGEKDPEATIAFFPDSSGGYVYSSAAVFGNPYAIRISPLWPRLRLVLLAVAAVLMGYSLLFTFFWVVKGLFQKFRGSPYRFIRLVPLLAVLTFVGMLFLSGSLFDGFGDPTPAAVVFFLASILFALLSIVALVLALRAFTSETAGGARFHALFVSLGCCVMTAFLVSWHLIGLRVWAP